MGYPSSKRLWMPLKGYFKIIFIIRGKVYAIMLNIKNDKKFCDNFDRRREPHQLVTAVVSRDKIMCGLNS